ncbi:hypothetical protein GCM10026987_25280 [Belliella aquatica]|uniref:DUF4221 domain-containing protein n=2 Tax=Belliella aquatica TaxID=1323734 RepID=A0ABQ1N6S1_9BACT|nr:hypothetical protein GCM10010993_30610 [Belliella aquatica]
MQLHLQETQIDSMKQKYILIILCTLLFACNKVDNEGKLSDYQSAENIIHPNTLNIHLEKTSEIEIQNPSLDHRFNKMSLDYIYQDSLLYYSYENVIKIVNLNNGDLSEIILNDFEIRGDIINVLPISKDSILTLQVMPPILMINNSKGDIFYKETLPYFPFDVDDLFWKSMNQIGGKGNFNFNLQQLRNLHFDKKEHTVHIPMLPVDYIFLEKVTNSQTIGVFDLNSRGWKGGYGKSRGIIRHRGNKNFSKIFDQNYFLVKGDTSYLSYPVSHHVFLINNKTDELIDEIVASSTSPESIPFPIDKDWLTSGDFVKLNEWRAESPFYSELMFHKEPQLFSRFYFHKKSISDSKKGTYWQNRKITLLVFDINLNLHQEIPVNTEIFELWRFLPTSDGFIVSEMNKQKALENAENIYLGYTVKYRLKKDGDDTK